MFDKWTSALNWNAANDRFDLSIYVKNCTAMTYIALQTSCALPGRARNAMIFMADTGSGFQTTIRSIEGLDALEEVVCSLIVMHCISVKTGRWDMQAGIGFLPPSAIATAT